ncbi:hypothetical protein NC652_033984 [Populus alba x Populus x berolinensis]|uniref:Uncharacterized protein n=1 Tax=Populus alba x Populus x berolinensis TaxID=444605 RepID=A0AAD6LUT3_9ROSI|nr:hypothetical protein NC652_033984 [Populus alba x Populus x berolinensis]KAJ6973684.1 hypothetical protein NC653_033889 [Populus alba x Populus x berolinensis]
MKNKRCSWWVRTGFRVFFRRIGLLYSCGFSIFT